MSGAGSSTSTSKLLAMVALVILAAVVVVLVLAALSRPEIRDAGELPGVAPTWGGQSASPEPTETPAISTDGLGAPTMDFLDSSRGARALPASCDSDSSRLEVTNDAGENWTTLPVMGVNVRQILSIDYKSESQIDLVATVGEACTPTVVSTYTNGEFWESYPQRLSEKIYSEPTTNDTVIVTGGTSSIPCLATGVSAGSSGAAVVRCAEEVGYLSDERAWVPIFLGQTVAHDAGDPSGAVTIAQFASGVCQGILVQRISALAEPRVLEARGCVPDATSDNQYALSVAGSDIWLWDQASVWHSPDAGLTWAKKGAQL